MQPEALVLRFHMKKTNDWYGWVCELNCTEKQSMSFCKPVEDGRRHRPQARLIALHTHITWTHKLCHQPPQNSERAWIETSFLKIIHDLSQRKSTWRAQWMKWKKKEIFVFFFVASTAFFARLQFYMQCTLSINYLTLARLRYFITSVMFMLSFTPCLNFRTPLDIFSVYSSFHMNRPDSVDAAPAQFLMRK